LLARTRLRAWAFKPTILAHCTLCSQFLAVHIVTMFANTVSHPTSASV
jgi:hypothetical protein